MFSVAILFFSSLVFGVHNSPTTGFVFELNCIYIIIKSRNRTTHRSNLSTFSGENLL